MLECIWRRHSASGISPIEGYSLFFRTHLLSFVDDSNGLRKSGPVLRSVAILLILSAAAPADSPSAKP